MPSTTLGAFERGHQDLVESEAAAELSTAAHLQAWSAALTHLFVYDSAELDDVERFAQISVGTLFQRFLDSRRAGIALVTMTGISCVAGLPRSLESTSCPAVSG